MPIFENLPRLEGNAIVEFTINGQSVLIEVDGENAPITAGNFVDLVQRGVYDGVAFHRVIEGFVAQGGDPQTLDPDFIGRVGVGGFIDPDTGEERTIPLEVRLEGDREPSYSIPLGTSVANGIFDPVLENERGAIAFARSSEPDTASSQFFFVLEDAPFLDGNFSVFGRVIEGLDVIDNLQRIEVQNLNPTIELDRVEDAEVISGLENLIQPEDLELSEPETIDLYRFRNTGFNTGTYLFVGQNERNSITNNPQFNQTFELEGAGNLAFTASTIEGDNLSPFFRLRSLATEGTFLLVGTEEYNAIFAEDSDQRELWIPEGFDEQGVDIPEFYLFGAGSGEGEAFNRFQNNENGTFLFAGPSETADILNDPNLSETFTNQGVAFESL